MKHSEILETITKSKGKTPTQVELASILDVSRNTISSRAFRDMEYSLNEVEKISKAFDIDLLQISWVNHRLEDIDTREIVSNCANEGVVKVVYRPDVYLSAGYGIEVVEEQSEYMVLDERLFYTDKGLRINPKNCEIVRVSGNSMSPEYRHGDRVIIDKSITKFSDGHIFAFRYNGECYIKEINLLGKKVKAVPLNKEYDPFYIEDAEDVKIFGRIIPRVRL